jgi:glycosyltransferase involved in cell wall biosynthesis
LLASDCFVLPSRYEGLPLVLTEACAAGKPIVVSDFDAAKEVIVSEENGLVVPREDSEALAAAMNRIIQDESLRTKLSSAAKKTSEQFSISNHVRAILRYANLAS